MVGLLTLKLILFVLRAQWGHGKGTRSHFAELDQQFVLLSERLAESVCRTYAAGMRACMRDQPVAGQTALTLPCAKALYSALLNRRGRPAGPLFC